MAKEPLSARELSELIFGPVPSRRLGRSLGVNNIPPKNCTYTCVYCQLGPTRVLTDRRSVFYDCRDLLTAVEAKLSAVGSEGVDYVTLVSDGEPTLDTSIGPLLAGIQTMGAKTAVITNGSLLWQPEVRSALSLADWVSIKVDAVEDRPWRRTDRPHKRLRLVHILSGLRQFASIFEGTLTTETMLVAGYNDAPDHVAGIARFVAGLGPSVAYIAVPTRPPAVPSIHGPDEAGLAAAYATFAKEMDSVELLTGYEGDGFSRTGDIAQDLLSITAVHPMRQDAVEKLIRENTDPNAARLTVEQLLGDGRLVRTEYGGKTFYLRRLESH